MLLALGPGRRRQPDLAQHERAIGREVVQARQVAAEVLAALEEDVEHQEVDRVEREVLGRRVVRVGHELFRVLLAHHLHQLAQRVRDHVGAVPAKDVRRNLVAE